MPSTAEHVHTPSTQEIADNHEHEVISGEGTLRTKLLQAPEWLGAEVILPRGTVKVETSSDALSQSSLSDISSKVGTIVEKGSFIIDDKGYELVLGEFLSAADSDAKRRLRQETSKGEVEANITLLYDGEVRPTDNQVLSPAMVIVHEQLTEQQIIDLRNKLPPNVPLIDGATNELLDDVGSKLREQERAGRHRASTVGKATLTNLRVKDLGGGATAERAAWRHTQDQKDTDWAKFQQEEPVFSRDIMMTLTLPIAVSLPH